MNDPDAQVRLAAFAGTTTTALESATVDVVWQLAFRIVTASDLHVGADDEDGPAALTLHRNPSTGLVELRGTTIAGLLRHYLDDWLKGYADHPNRAEDARVRQLLGGGDDADTASALITWDAPLHGPHTPQLRSSVSIDPATAVARPGRLFETEVLPKGACFIISAELRIRHPRAEDGLLRSLVTAAAGLQRGGIRAGRRTASGNGELAADRWTARRLDVTTGAGWWAWRARSWPERRAADRAAVEAGGHDNLLDALTNGLTAAGLTLAVSPWPDCRRRFVVSATLRPVIPGTIDSPGTLLIRDNPADPFAERAPDHAHRFDAVGAVVQGSALYGAARAGTRRILSALVPDDAERRRRILVALWGDEPADSDRSGPARKRTLRPSRVRITEPVLAGAVPVRVTRNRIDALDGHVVKRHLVTDEVSVGGAGQVELVVRNPTPADRALIVFLLRDLHDGLINVGGASGIGHGQFHVEDGHASDHPDGERWTLDTLWHCPTSPLAGWAQELHTAALEAEAR